MLKIHLPVVSTYIRSSNTTLLIFSSVIRVCQKYFIFVFSKVWRDLNLEQCVCRAIIAIKVAEDPTDYLSCRQVRDRLF